MISQLSYNCNSQRSVYRSFKQFLILLIITVFTALAGDSEIKYSHIQNSPWDAKPTTYLILDTIPGEEFNGDSLVSSLNYGDISRIVFFPIKADSLGNINKKFCCITKSEESITKDSIDLSEIDTHISEIHTRNCKVDLLVDITDVRFASGVALDNLVYNVKELIKTHHFDGIVLSPITETSVTRQDTLNYQSLVYKLMLKKNKLKDDHNLDIAFNVIVNQYEIVHDLTKWIDQTIVKNLDSLTAKHNSTIVLPFVIPLNEKDETLNALNKLKGELQSLSDSKQNNTEKISKKIEDIDKKIAINSLETKINNLQTKADVYTHQIKNRLKQKENRLSYFQALSRNDLDTEIQKLENELKSGRGDKIKEDLLKTMKKLHNDTTFITVLEKRFLKFKTSTQDSLVAKNDNIALLYAQLENMKNSINEKEQLTEQKGLEEEKKREELKIKIADMEESLPQNTLNLSNEGIPQSIFLSLSDTLTKPEKKQLQAYYSEITDSIAVHYLAPTAVYNFSRKYLGTHRQLIRSILIVLFVCFTAYLIICRHTTLLYNFTEKHKIINLLIYVASIIAIGTIYYLIRMVDPSFHGNEEYIVLFLTIYIVVYSVVQYIRTQTKYRDLP